MSRRRSPLRGLAPLVAAWALSVAATGAQSASGPSADIARREIGPGVEYRHWREQLPLGPLSIHAAVIDWTRSDVALQTPLARGTVTGLSTVADQIRALPPFTGTPLVAVNADFFVIEPGPYRGDPRGLQVCNGEVVSDPAGTATFWVDANGRPGTAIVESRFEARFHEGRSVPFGLNERRPEDSVVLYTPRLGSTTHTSGGRELVLRPLSSNDPVPRLGATLTAEVIEIHTGGNRTIPTNGMILSLGPESPADRLPARPGDRIELSFATDPPLDGLDAAIAGGPVLVSQGRPREWKLPQPRHPRTAIGWNDRELVLVVVDGRQPRLSIGMTFPELADLMVRLGCQEAINLDGGGSSTLWIQGRVVNSPSDGRERAVANSLIFLRSAPLP